MHLYERAPTTILASVTTTTPMNTMNTFYKNPAPLKDPEIPRTSVEEPRTPVRPGIKPSKLSGGSARARLGGLHAQFGLLGGMTLSLGLGSVRPSSPLGCSGSVCATKLSRSAEHARFDSRPDPCQRTQNPCQRT